MNEVVDTVNKIVNGESEENKEVSTDPLALAKAEATGIVNDKTPMTSEDIDIDGLLTGSIDELSENLESTYFEVNFKAGQTSAEVEITAPNNFSSNGERKFNLTLSACGDEVISQAYLGCTVEIVDDEKAKETVIEFAEKKFISDKKNAYIEVEVIRSGDDSTVASVNIQTIEDTAVAGRDFSDVNAQLVFPFGISSRKVKIPIQTTEIDDNVKFSVKLTNPTGCTIGSKDSAVCTINKLSNSFLNRSLAESSPSENITVNTVVFGDNVKMGEAQNSAKFSYYGDKVWYYKSNENKQFNDSVGLEVQHHDHESGLSYYDNFYGYDGFYFKWKRTSRKSYWGRAIFSMGNVDVAHEASRYYMYETSEERWSNYRDCYFYAYTDKSRSNGEKIGPGLLWGDSEMDAGIRFENTQSRHSYKESTLYIEDLKPILRPFQVTLGGSSEVTVDDGLGNKLTLGSEAQCKLINSGSDNRTVIVIGDTIDIALANQVNPYVYISGIRLINQETGSSAIIENDLPEGTYDWHLTLTPEFIKKYNEFIGYSLRHPDNDANKNGYYGKIQIVPILKNSTATIKGNDDSRATLYVAKAKTADRVGNIYDDVLLSDNELKFNKGDTLRISVDNVAAGYRCDKIKITVGDYSYYLERVAGSEFFFVPLSRDCTITPYLESTLSPIKIVSSVSLFSLNLYNEIGEEIKQVSSEKNSQTGVTTYTFDMTGLAEGQLVKVVGSPFNSTDNLTYRRMFTESVYKQNIYCFYVGGSAEGSNTICVGSDAKHNVSLHARFLYDNITIDGLKNNSDELIPAASIYYDQGKFSNLMSGKDGTFSIYTQISNNGYIQIYAHVNGNIVICEKYLGHYSSKTESIDIGDIILPAYSANTPSVTSVSAYDENDNYIDAIPIGNNKITRLVAQVINDNREYTTLDTGSGRVKEKVEHVVEVLFDVYDGRTNKYKWTIENTEEGSSIPIHSQTDDGGKHYYIDYVFKNGDDDHYSPGDKIYARVVTDYCYYYTGGPNTYYAPIKTRLFFTGTLTQIEQTFDLGSIVSDTSGTYSLPVLGNLDTNFDLGPVALSVSALQNNRIRISFGIIPVSASSDDDDDGDEYVDPTNPHSLIKAGGIKNTLTLMKEYYKGHFSNKVMSMGLMDWSFHPHMGIYFDIAVTYSKDVIDGKTKSNFCVAGGGGYFGISGDFSYRQYITIAGFPIYFAFGVELSAVCQMGYIEEESQGYLSREVLMDNISQIRNGFDNRVIASLGVSAKVGVGVDEVIGANGQVSLDISFMYMPTVDKYLEENDIGKVRSLGWEVDGSFSINLDVVLTSVECYSYQFLNYQQGYFADMEEIEGKEPGKFIKNITGELTDKARQSQSSVMNTENAPERNLLNDAPARSKSSQSDEQILISNNYDEPEITLTAFDSNSDGVDDKVLMTYLDDEISRPANQRTVLKYSFYDIASKTWSVPQILQDDGTADFMPCVENTKDGLLIAWTSRDSSSSVATHMDILKSLEIYCCFIDKETMLPGEITRLTNDNYYDVSPTISADPTTGDILIHYTKAAVTNEILTGKDLIEAASAIYNMGEPVYMLYSGSEHKFITDMYFENELAQGANAQELINNWGGQRFLSSVIADQGINNPVIYDFDAGSVEFGVLPNISDITNKTVDELEELDEDEYWKIVGDAYDYAIDNCKSYSVYAFTVDADKNINTETDRELYIQIYDYANHFTTAPIRITNDNVSDTSPRIEGNYLFWMHDGELTYMSIPLNCAYNLYIQNNKIGERVVDKESENLDIGWWYELVDIPEYEGSERKPEIANFSTFEDPYGDLYITWYDNAMYNGKYCEEIFVSALNVTEDYDVVWSCPQRITYSVEFDDLPKLVMVSDDEVMMLHNSYTYDEENTVLKHCNIKYSYLKDESVLSPTIFKKSSAADVKSKGQAEVTVALKNIGITTCTEFEAQITPVKNGAPCGETVSISKNYMEDGTFISSAASYNVPVSFNLTDIDNIDDYKLKVVSSMYGGAPTTTIVDIYEKSPSYELSNLEVNQNASDIVLTGIISNNGSAPSNSNDLVNIAFEDIYYSDSTNVIFAEETIGNLCGSIDIGESKGFSINLDIPSDKLELGITNCALRIIGDKGVLAKSDVIDITLTNPYFFDFEGEDKNGTITLMVDEVYNLPTTYGASKMYQGGEITAVSSDDTVARIEEGKIIAMSEGETTVKAAIEPYGGTKTVKVVVTEGEQYNCEPSNGSIWAIGSDNSNLSYNADVKASDIIRVKIDGNILSVEDYEIIDNGNGTSSVKVKAAYLNELEIGDHTIKIVTGDGVAKSEFKVSDRFSAFEDIKVRKGFDKIISDNIGGNFSYKSSDESIVSVDENGVISYHKRGNATITITDNETGLQKTINVKARFSLIGLLKLVVLRIIDFFKNIFNK